MRIQYVFIYIYIYIYILIVTMYVKSTFSASLFISKIIVIVIKLLVNSY